MRTAVWILVLGLSACHSSSPTAPTPPPAPPVSPLPPADRIVAMSVLGNQWIATNSAPLQMTARVFTRLGFGDSPGEYVDTTEHVTWSVDPAGVVAVDRLGRVTPVANGTARVVATLGERSASISVRVLPDYSGTWSGEYIITGCSGAVDFRTCPRLMFGETNTRQRYPFRLSLAQERDLVSGELVRHSAAVGDRITPVVGLVRLGGSLVIEATVPQPGLEPFRLTNSSISFNGAYSHINGSFTLIAPYRSFGDTLLTMRTEHEFTNIPREP